MNSNNSQQIKTILWILLLSFSLGSCTPDVPPDSLPDWTVENVSSGDTVNLWSEKEGKHYQIKLACIKAIDSKDSRLLLEGNLQDFDSLKLDVVEEIGIDKKENIYKVIGEVSIDLGDGFQSLNEAQLLSGMAILKEDATKENCPRLEALKLAQSEAMEAKVGVWSTVK